MKVRALKTIYGDGAITRRDETIDVSAVRGRQLIAKGYAVEVGSGPVVPQARKDASAAEVASGNPSPGRQTGGQTGEDNALSLSQEDRPRRKRRSTSQEDDAE